MDSMLENGYTKDNTPNKDAPEFIPHFDQEGEPVSSLSVGDWLEVYRPEEDDYYPGVIGEVTTDGQQVRYDNGDSATLATTNEQCRYSNLLSVNVAQFPRLISESPKVLS